MALWTLRDKGTITAGEVVAPDERLSWPRTVSLGMQHVIAMFGATFLVPLITGFPPSTTLFFSAIGTAIFLTITGNRLPSYLGSSFAFIAPILAVGGGDPAAFASDPTKMGKALFGVMCAGVLLALVGGIVHAVGSAWLDAFMPPIMTGTIVMLIGFNLAGAAWGGFKNQPASAWVTIIAVVAITVLFRGILGRLSILLGVLVGYAVAGFQGQLDFGVVREADWVGLPSFHGPSVDFSVLGMFLPVVLVLVAENVGHVKSVATMTGRNYDKSIGRALLADGVATAFAGLGGGSGTTTYAENIGVMAATKV
ncbi:MAG: nitrate reductase, partial [Micrococcales bacterium]|nr:nitrate reductase [Micrococcales bacterium]